MSCLRRRKLRAFAFAAFVFSGFHRVGFAEDQIPYFSGPNVDLYVELKKGNENHPEFFLELRPKKEEDEKIPRLWNLYRVGADLAQQWIRSSGIEDSLVSQTVGLIDTGFNEGDPAFEGRFEVLRQSKVLSYVALAHGTNVASIVSANLNSSLGQSLPLKIAASSYLSPSGLSRAEDETYQDRLMSSIEDLFSHSHPVVVSASLRFGEDESYLEALQSYGLGEDSIFVNSVGNEYANLNESYYELASELEVAFVGSISPFGVRSTFSNQVDSLFLVAPGENVPTLMFSRKVFNDGIGQSPPHANGTSFAVPHLTAMIGGLASTNEKLNRKELLFVVKETAIDLGPPGKDEFYGHGLLNMYGGIRLAQLSRDLELEDALHQLKVEGHAEYEKGIDLLQSGLDEYSKAKIEQGFRLVREAYFLDPNNPEIIETLYLLERFLGWEHEAISHALRLYSIRHDFAYFFDLPEMEQESYLSQRNQLAMEIGRRRDITLDLRGEYLFRRENLPSIFHQVAKLYGLGKKIREKDLGKDPTKYLRAQLVGQIRSPQDIEFLFDAYQKSEDSLVKELVHVLLYDFIGVLAADPARETVKERLFTPKSRAALGSLLAQIFSDIRERKVDNPVWPSSLVKQSAHIAEDVDIPLEVVGALLDSTYIFEAGHLLFLIPGGAEKVRENLLGKCTGATGMNSLMNVVALSVCTNSRVEFKHGNVSEADIEKIRFLAGDRVKELWKDVTPKESEVIWGRGPNLAIRLLAIVGVEEVQERVKTWFQSDDEGERRLARDVLLSLEFSPEEFEAHLVHPNERKELAEKIAYAVRLSEKVESNPNEFEPSFFEWMKILLYQMEGFHPSQVVKEELQLQRRLDGPRLEFSRIEFQSARTVRKAIDTLNEWYQDPDKSIQVDWLCTFLHNSIYGYEWSGGKSGREDVTVSSPRMPIHSLLPEFMSALSPKDLYGNGCDLSWVMAGEAQRNPELADRFFETLETTAYENLWISFQGTAPIRLYPNAMTYGGAVDEEKRKQGIQVRSPVFAAFLIDFDRAQKLYRRVARAVGATPEEEALGLLEVARIANKSKHFFPSAPEKFWRQLSRALFKTYPDLRDSSVQRYALTQMWRRLLPGRMREFINRELISLFFEADSDFESRRLAAMIFESRNGRTLRRMRGANYFGWSRKKQFQYRGLLRRLEAS